VKHVDVGITYALLLGGLALDAAALIMLLVSNRAMVFLEQSTKRLAWLSRAVTRWQRRHSSNWSGVASQMNLISYCLEKPGPYSNEGRGGSRSNRLLADGGTSKNRRWLLIAAKMLRMEEMVDDLVFIQHVKLIFSNKEEDPYGTLEFIFDGLKHTAHNVGNNKESIKQVCNRRGAGVLQDLQEETYKALKNDRGKLKVIMESVENRGLDESLLLWHIATDLCLLRRDGDGDKSPPGGPLVEDEDSRPMLRRMRAISKILSEYILYLLIKHPEMLPVRTGIWLVRYRDTCEEARRFFASRHMWISSHDDAGCFFNSMQARIDTDEDARRMLLSVKTSEKPMRVKGDRSKSVLFDGVILAKVLRELDKGLMWRLVSGLWQEMLMFLAVSSRGSTHVRSLNRGGELITIVWLLMQHMGLSDMYEIEQVDPILQLLPPPPSPARRREVLGWSRQLSPPPLLRRQLLPKEEHPEETMVPSKFSPL
jgi:hypothetical protein